MNNATIAHQLERAHYALEQLAGAGVLVRRIQIGQSQDRPTIVCVATHAGDYRMDTCGGCRLVWTGADEAGAATDEAAPAEAPPDALHADTRIDHCRHCHCTDLTACQHEDGEPCFWVAPGLCSVCAEAAGVDIDAHRMYGAEADIGHAIAGTARGDLPR